MKALIVMLLCLSAFLIIGSAQVKPQRPMSPRILDAMR